LRLWHKLAPHRLCQPIPGRHLPALAGRLASLARMGRVLGCYELDFPNLLAVHKMNKRKLGA